MSQYKHTCTRAAAEETRRARAHARACRAREHERKIQVERSSSWLITATKTKESAAAELHPCVGNITVSPSLVRPSLLTSSRGGRILFLYSISPIAHRSF